MPNLVFSFDTGVVTIPRIMDGMALKFGYQPTIPHPVNPGQTIPNPQSKTLFAKDQMRRIVIDAVFSAESDAATIAANATITKIVLGD